MLQLGQDYEGTCQAACQGPKQFGQLSYPSPNSVWSGMLPWTEVGNVHKLKMIKSLEKPMSDVAWTFCTLPTWVIGHEVILNCLYLDGKQVHGNSLLVQNELCLHFLVIPNISLATNFNRIHQNDFGPNIIKILIGYSWMRHKGNLSLTENDWTPDFLLKYWVHEFQYNACWCM